MHTHTCTLTVCTIKGWSVYPLLPDLLVMTDREREVGVRGSVGDGLLHADG